MKQVPLMMFIVVVVASGALSQEPTYGTCGYTPDTSLNLICQSLHPAEKGAVDVVGIANCLGEDCFKKHDGYEIKVVAKGKPGEYPKTWHAWVTPQGGKLDSTKYKGDQCILPDKEKVVGTGVQKIGSETALSKSKPVRCKAEREVGEYLYHEHFASNEANKCLVWIECRENLPK